MFADLATAAPSAAGLYFASDGGLHVLVVRPADDGAARAAVASMMSKGRIKSERRNQSPPVTIERAQFTFAELSDWRDLESDSVLTDLPGLVMLDLDERRNRVVVGIALDAPASTRAAIQSRSARLGIDSGAVVIENMPALKLQSSAPTPMALSLSPGVTLNSNFDSLVGGIDVRMNGAGTCTSGPIVEHNGVPKMVLPTHCSTTWGGLDNTTVSNGGNLRGVESDDPAWYWCGVNHCRDSDASLFQLNSPSYPNYKRGRIARPTSRSNTAYGPLVVDTINPYFEVAAIDLDNTIVGQEVQKVGHVTGWTYGNVTETCANIYKGSFPPPYDLTRCAYKADYISDGGDSGSPVFKWSSGNSVLLLGTHIGRDGDASFSKFSRIASEMGGSMLVAAVDERPLGVQISGPNYLPVSTAGQWLANQYGGTGPYTFTWTVDGQTITNTSTLDFTFQTTGGRSINLTVSDAKGATVTQSYSAYAY